MIEALFFSVGHSRKTIATSVADYNEHRPRSSMLYQTPAAYAATLTAMGAGRATPTSSAVGP